jgi:hypothetical protein
MNHLSSPTQNRVSWVCRPYSCTRRPATGANICILPSSVSFSLMPFSNPLISLLSDKDTRSPIVKITTNCAYDSLALKPVILDCIVFTQTSFLEAPYSPRLVA